MPTEPITVDSRGVRLAAELHLPGEGKRAPCSAVIVCHGLGSCKESHASFAGYLTEQGFAALVFDWRGHGASEGTLDGDTLEDVGAALAYLQTRPEIDASRIALRGSSMGGTMAILAAAQYPALRSVVAVCPANGEVLLRGIGYVPFWLSMNPSEGTRFRLTVPDFYRFLAGHDVSQAVARISPRPLLLIHGQRDEVVPYQHSESLFARAGDPKRLWLLPNAMHQDAQRDPAVHEETVRWLREVMTES